MQHEPLQYVKRDSAREALLSRALFRVVRTEAQEEHLRSAQAGGRAGDTIMATFHLQLVSTGRYLVPNPTVMGTDYLDPTAPHSSTIVHTL